MDHEKPRPLRKDEIPRVCRDYAHAADCAKRAGFDGVEIHAGHGYLIDQFINDRVNLRTDEYGGSIPNRVRLLVEVTEAVLTVWPPGRVAVRMSPSDDETYHYHGSSMSSGTAADAAYSYAIQQIDKFGLAYLFLSEPRWNALFDVDPVNDPGFSMPLVNSQKFRKDWHGVLMGAGGFTPLSGKKAVEEGSYDMIAFGRWFISNPDLPRRLKENMDLNKYNRD